MTASFWPAGKRMAVMFNVAYEAWSEGKTSAIGPMGNVLSGGLFDTQAHSWGNYAPRRGIWRLMAILERHGIRANVFTSACLAEREPDSVRALADAGHEIACHAYAQDILPVMLDEPTERQEIARCIDLLSAVTGKRPSGWVSPRATPSQRTAALIAEAGLTWFGDCFDEDLPYVKNFNNRRLVFIPMTMDVNDLALYVRHGNAPRQVLEVFNDTFQRLYNDEANPGHLDVTAHAHVFGRPAGAWVFEEIIRIVKGYPDVWIPTRSEVAQLALDRLKS